MCYSLPRNAKGFSLVELMVTVAIIGILTSIAIPAYDQLTAKAKQTEAKGALAGIYAAEMAFYAEQNSFTCCLYQAGYEPDGMNFSYYTGFFNANCVWISDFKTGTSCSGGGVAWKGMSRNDATFPANIYANPGLRGAGVGGAYEAHYTTFNGVAFGSISATSNVFDTWQIDQGKNLINVQSGIQ